MREWLTVIIVLLIITVLLDGLRRMRAHRKSSIKMSLSMHQGTTKDDLDDFGSELPNGGARVVNVRDEHDTEGLNQNIREQANKQKIKKPYRIPEQVSLNLDEHVPLLMESVDEVESSESDSVTNKNTAEKKPSPKRSTSNKSPRSKPTEPRSDVLDDLSLFDNGGRVEPSFSLDDDSSLDFLNESNNADNYSSKYKEENDSKYSSKVNYDEDELEDVLMSDSHSEPSGESELDLLRAELAQSRTDSTEDESLNESVPQQADNTYAEESVHETASQHIDSQQVSQDAENKTSRSLFDDVDVPEGFDNYQEDIAAESSAASSTNNANAVEDDENYAEPEDVLVINVMADKGEYFHGEDLLNVVLSQGMRFGSMNIFHHHEDSENEGCILYSMANLVKPGTFDINDMKNFKTPGVSLFMPLPLESDSLAAFDKMVGTARAIAIQLYGDLKDENRSVFTKQTVEHYRTRIQEFERKHRLKSPA